jgi:hypothetical protein
MNNKSKILASHYDNKMAKSFSEMNMKGGLIGSNSYFSLRSFQNTPVMEGNYSLILDIQTRTFTNFKNSISHA